MSRLSTLAFIVLLSRHAASIPAAAGVELVAVKVAEGTPVEIELKTNISSEKIKAGVPVDFEVVQPVKIGEVTVLERGAPVKARIGEAKKARHWGRQGGLTLIPEGVLAVDGGRIGLHFAEPEIRDEGHTKAAGVATAILLSPFYAYYFPFTAVAVAEASRKGQAFVIPAGDRFEVYVASDVMVKAGPSSPPAGHPAEQNTQPAVTAKEGEGPVGSEHSAPTSAGEEADAKLNLGQRYLLLKNYGKHLQAQLTAATGAGFRVTGWQRGAMILEKVAAPPDTYRYLRVESSAAAARLQNQLNAASASGFRLLQGSAWSWEEEAFPLGYHSSYSSALLEKAPHPHNYRYLLVDLPLNTNSFLLKKKVEASREKTARAMAEAYQQGYREVGQMGPAARGVGGGFAVLEKPIATLPGQPAGEEFETDRFLSLHATKTSALQEELSEAASRGYRITASGCLEKVAKPPDTFEYELLPNKKGPKLEKELNEAGARGFHFSPSPRWLEKAPHSTGQYEYLVLEDTQLSALNEAMAEPVAQGYRPVTVVAHSGVSKVTLSLIMERENQEKRDQ